MLPGRCGGDPIGLRGGLLTYGYAQRPLLYTDPSGLKPYVFQINVGGGVSLLPIVAQVVNLKVVDALKGETCNYTVSCIGVGLAVKDIPGIGAGTHPVTWDDGKTCSDCRQFQGHGLSGFLAFQVGPFGYTLENWYDVPNGPRLDFSGWSFGEISVGGGTMMCHFNLR
jgi:hypothetical protein